MCNLSHYVLLLTLLLFMTKNTANVFVSMVEFHIEGMIPMINFKKRIDMNNEDDSMRLS